MQEQEQTMKRMVEERVQQARSTGCVMHVVLCLVEAKICSTSCLRGSSSWGLHYRILNIYFYTYIYIYGYGYMWLNQNKRNYSGDYR